MTNRESIKHWQRKHDVQFDQKSVDGIFTLLQQLADQKNAKIDAENKLSEKDTQLQKLERDKKKADYNNATEIKRLKEEIAKKKERKGCSIM